MALAGRIVEYLDGGKFICAFVLEESGKRLRAVNQNGRDVNLAAGRLIHQSTGAYPLGLARDGIIDLLRNTAKARTQLTSAVGLEEIWILVSEEKESSFKPQFLAELFFGAETDDNHVAAFLRSLFHDRLYFKFKEGRVIAHSPEAVENLIQQQEKQKRLEELLEKGAKAVSRIWHGDEPDTWPETDSCLEMIADYYLHGNEAKQSASARDLLKRAGLIRPHDAFHLLVKSGCWGKHQNIGLLRQGISTEFPHEAAQQAAALKPLAPEELLQAGRKDFRSLDLLTIDGESTRDFDDALHVEKRGDNFLVGVHITDVSCHIQPDTPLFQEALNRGTTIYFPEAPLPMLPALVSEDICSLIAGQPRPALSFMILLSPDAELLDFDLFASVITVKRQLHYAEANQLLATDPDLDILASLSRKLLDKRLQSGALPLPFPDVIINVDNEDSVEISTEDSDTPSRMLISEFMILANTLGARYLAEREVPGLFRSQPPPRQRLFSGMTKDLFTNIRQRKKLSPMTLSVKPKAHSGLGVSQYTTLSSPIRRFLDLVMQHQILSLVSNNCQIFAKAELKKFAESIGQAVSRANSVKQIRHRYWILKYLEARRQELLDGMLIDKGPNRAHVLLKDFMMDADVPKSQVGDIAQGETFKVRITKIDALDNLLRIERAG